MYFQEHLFWYGCSESWVLNQDPHTADHDEEVSVSSTTGTLHLLKLLYVAL